jgi:biopolymer transport protein ExbB
MKPNNLRNFIVAGVCVMLWLSAPLAAQQARGAKPADPSQQPPSTQTQLSRPEEPAAAALPQAPSDTKERPEFHAAEPAPRELSPWSMFLSADIVVKIVMTGLAFASLMTWTVFFAKSFELSRARSRLSRALARISEAPGLTEAQLILRQESNILSSMLAVALQELKLSSRVAGGNGIKERAASSFSELTRSEARAIRHGIGLLATIGAIAPFVGLFGTVWGIMNSFIGISKSQTTNLAVVAPGIAEALLATAIGLVAAIPAVIIYNYFSRATKVYLDLVARASGSTARLLSRDLDRRYSSIHSRAAE